MREPARADRGARGGARSATDALVRRRPARDARARHHPRRPRRRGTVPRRLGIQHSRDARGREERRARAAARAESVSTRPVGLASRPTRKRTSMKIARVDALHCDGGWRPWTFVRVETDDGLVGWGECSDNRSPYGIAGCVRDMAHLLVGQDPRPIERLYWDMLRLTRQNLGRSEERRA